ncbi:L-threonylcarbamoyladenylate synthase [Candidatus Omnitrophota bacterium]
MNTQVVKIDPEHIDQIKIKRAAEVIRDGGIVAFPTETVYGLAAEFSNQQAARRIAQIKNRPPEKAFTVQVEKVADLEKLNCEISDFAYQLMERFWPGPLTLVLPTKNGKTLGVRIPDHQIARSLIRTSQTAIVAPSANLSGEPPAQDAKAALKIFDGLIEMIIDGGRTKLGLASTVVDLSVSPYRVLRAGAITQQEIQSVQN